MLIAARLILAAEPPFAATEPVSIGNPDPRLAANLYCAGRLDRVIQEVVVPFRRDLRALDPERRCRFWMLRYARGGEHLKVRIHCPEEHGPILQESLEAAASNFFARLDDSVEPLSRRKGAPPVDDADLEDGTHPDRLLVWTRHRRSPVVLGDPSLLGNDAYVVRLVACLADGCEAILDAFEPDSSGTIPFSRRQRTLSRLVAAGLSAVFPGLGQRRAFLAYHRDWVVRSLVLGKGAGPEKARSLLERFRAENHGPVRRLLDSLDDPGRRIDPAEAAWCESLTALRSFLDPLTGDPDYDLDPFASGPVFPTLFKVFQGIANPLGISPLNEALAHHLLLCATGEDDFIDRFELVP